MQTFPKFIALLFFFLPQLINGQIDTSLYYSIINDDLESVKLALDEGANISSIIEQRADTILSVLQLTNLYREQKNIERAVVLLQNAREKIAQKEQGKLTTTYISCKFKLASENM